MRKLLPVVLLSALLAHGCDQAAPPHSRVPTPAPSAAVATGAPKASSVEDAVLEVNALNASGEYAAAAELATESLAKYPGNLMLLTNRGTTYFQMEQFETASEDFTAALKIAPPEARWTLLSQRARCAMEMGRREQAEKDFAQAAKEIEARPDPMFAEQMYRLRGTNLADWGKYKDSVPCFTRALEIQPENPRALAGRTVAYARLGDKPRLKADLRRLEKIAPEAAEALRAEIAEITPPKNS